jgi:2,4-dienoyl-CoA reductase-like NADH-dependent reductase (Old Yellow Enzyme family)
MAALLFTPLSLRGLEFKNRIFVSPMCQYSARDGMPTDWHFVHLGSRAVGGAALVNVEATAVSPEGRISPDDTGIWSENHARAFARIVEFIHEQRAHAGMQLAHAGRKASTIAPWKGGRKLDPPNGGWEPLAPSAVPFAEDFPTPRVMTGRDFDQVRRQFAEAAKRAQLAGFDVIEIHAAHGYLLHEFLSPLSNGRADSYGGSLENRMRFPLEVVRTVRAAWPAEKPLFVRVSATDWTEGGWDLEQTVEFARQLRCEGVDLVDCSSGGLVKAAIPAAPGYQVKFSAAVRSGAQIATGAVGMILEAAQAEQTLVTGQADAVFLARQLLRNPYWPLQAARALGVSVDWPVQYQRARD